MKKVGWVMDGDVWELDMSTPKTLEGSARALPGDPLPLGLSRGIKLSRPKQIDFFHRFMTTPLVPSYSSHHGFSLQRVLAIPFSDNWFATLLGQFDLQKFVSAVKKSRFVQQSNSDRLHTIMGHLRDKSLYGLGFNSEVSLTPDDTLLLSYDSCGDDKKTPRKKAVFHHKFLHHNLTTEAVWPGLFVDTRGDYWDVPFSMAIDLASLPVDSGPSYHFCLRHNDGLPKLFEGDKTSKIPATLLPALSFKSAFSYKKSIDIWRSRAQKLKMVQPFDAFLSNPHISASGIIGAVMTASFGNNSVRSEVEDNSQGLRSIFADTFGCLTLTAQHGNFQKLFSDLTRFHLRLNFPSGSRFLSGAARLSQDLLNSQQLNVEAVQAMCPSVSFCLQQQIAGPISFRVDSGVEIDLKRKDNPVHLDDSVLAVEYALQVLGSAKAVAWYSLKRKEFMVELRFFET